MQNYTDRHRSADHRLLTTDPTNMHPIQCINHILSEMQIFEKEIRWHLIHLPYVITAHFRYIDLASKHPKKPFVYFEDEVWSYQRMNDYANRVARVFWNAGARKNDTVGFKASNVDLQY